MGMLNKFRDLIGLEEYEDDEEFEEESYSQPSYYEKAKAEPKAPMSSQRFETGNIVSMQSKTVKSITNAFKLVVIEPQGFDECSRLVDNLKSRKPVIVNLEKLEPDTARKIFDFLGGATYALNGNVQKVSSNIFIFAPENVAIYADGENRPYSFSGSEENPWK
ncbi:MAG: cell division protein SepF [Clostridiales bacterium]|nr:cell division protein SepF [Clostridiales bacterium]MDD7035430.1 cell division protein SepF [Bacillota bacterium]MDY2919994.1 cell division protein SepF [Lentihominibacter sp.]